MSVRTLNTSAASATDTSDFWVCNALITMTSTGFYRLLQTKGATEDSVTSLEWQRNNSLTESASLAIVT